MKRRPNKDHLPAEFVRTALSYDPTTGLFRWKRRKDRPKKWNTRFAGTVAGYISCGYRLIQLEPERGGYRAARIAWIYMTGEWPPDQVDHINGQRGDDRWENLRLANNAENNRNRGAQRNNQVGLRGVSVWGSRWQARICVDGVRYRIGAFDTPEAAAEAYAAEARRLHREFARVK